MRAKILNASAGSGKTYTLAYNYIRDVIWQPSLYRHILAVTFTNKATEEMKSRILSEINTLAKGGNSNYLSDLEAELSLSEGVIRHRAKRVLTLILHDYSHFTILTIDKFFQRILHAFIKELGIDLNYNLELESAPVLSRSVDALIEQITSDATLRNWLIDFSSERIEESVGWDLRGDIMRLGSELFKEGNRTALNSARTKLELEEIVKHATQKEFASRSKCINIAKAAISKIEGASLTLDNFSYKSTSGASYFYKVAAGNIDAPSQRARNCSSSLDGWMTKSNTKLHSSLIAELQSMMAEICQIYDHNIEEWNSTSLLRANYRTFALLSDLYKQVSDIWRKENSLLLSETKNILAAFIEENDAPFIYEKTGNRFDRYYIDEFQDTSNREWLNFLPLLKEAMSHRSQTLSTSDEEVGPSVLLVGDIKQSIYRWRGGDWRILGISAKDSLGDVKIENLEYNFRSLKNIVNFNNEIISSVVTSANSALKEKLSESKIDNSLKEQLGNMLPTAYNSHRQTARKSGSSQGYISIERFDQMPPITECICNLLDLGYKPTDIMILVRSSNDGTKAAETLLEFKRTNQNPKYQFDIMTQDALALNSSPLCSFLLSTLRLSVDNQDSISRAIYNRWLGQSVQRALSSQELEFVRSLGLIHLEEALEQIILKYELGKDGENSAYLQAFHQQVINFSSGRIADIPLFLNWWDESCTNTSLTIEKRTDTIEITTIHKAKGLERKVVIIPYLSWGLEPRSGESTIWATADGSLSDAGCVPVKYGAAMATSQYAESYYRELTYSYVDNINLLYVALTRAVEQLHIFIPQPHRSTNRANVGEHLWKSLSISGNSVNIGTMSGRYELLEDGRERCSFGELSAPDTKGGSKPKSTQVVTLSSYPTVSPSPGLKLPTSKFLEHGGEVEFSPRNFGILMHRIFEQAEDFSQIEREIQKIEQEALLSSSDIEELKSQIKLSLNEPTVNSWFSGDWDKILSERDIILPKSEVEDSSTKRPDRVMIKGNRAIVVDYKFGLRSSSDNRRQIGRYAELLKRMGYTQIEGWIWYVRQGRIERIV